MSQYSVSPTITSNVDFNTGSWSGYSYFPVDCTSGNITILLPTSVWSGLSFYFNRIDSSTNTLTFQPHTGTIDNATTLLANPKNTIEVVYDGVSNWFAPRFSYT